MVAPQADPDDNARQGAQAVHDHVLDAAIAAGNPGLQSFESQRERHAGGGERGPAPPCAASVAPGEHTQRAERHVEEEVHDDVEPIPPADERMPALEDAPEWGVPEGETPRVKGKMDDQEEVEKEDLFHAAPRARRRIRGFSDERLR